MIATHWRGGLVRQLRRVVDAVLRAREKLRLAISLGTAIGQRRITLSGGPLIAETRKRFDQKLAQKKADFAKREAILRQTEGEIAKARESINDEVAKKLKAEGTS